MFNILETCMINTNVEPLQSGSRIFRQNEKFDINELHRVMNDNSKFVVICNDVSANSEKTKKQLYIMTDVLTAEEGYADTYMFAHYGRSESGATNRKLMLSFSEINDEPTLKATYFNS